MTSLSPSTLFKTSATIYALASAGHVFMGFDLVYPALRTIPPSPRNAKGQRGAENCWNYVAASLMTGALLNWQWSRTLGPRTQEEKMILYLLAATHAMSGFRYAQVKAYEAFALMWSAPAFTLAAIYLS